MILKSKIFGIGLSRTGTTTLTDTLNQLGYNIIHYPNDHQMFNDPNNDGCTDIPVTVNYKKLDELWPRSKFIYTIRDKDEWVESIVPYLERKRNWNMNSKFTQNRAKLYGDPFPNARQASEAYERHSNDVINYFKNRSDMLLLNILK